MNESPLDRLGGNLNRASLLAAGLGEDLQHREELQSQFMQATETAMLETMTALKAVGEKIEQFESIVLWLSKQQWPQPQDQTWEGLLAAYDAEVNPEPLPELPARAYRVGK